MYAVRQRIIDWRRERRIQRLERLCAKLREAGELARVHKHWYEMVDEIHARSPGQIARMRRRAGL